MKPQIVNGDHSIVLLGQTMRRAALREFVTKNPQYSRDEAEALAKARPFQEALSQDEAIQCLIFPPGKFVSVVLSVDAYEEPKRWHLSMSRILDPQTLTRVDDETAKRIASCILPEGTEGAAEGGIRQARHFFAPYKAP